MRATPAEDLIGFVLVRGYPEQVKALCQQGVDGGRQVIEYTSTGYKEKLRAVVGSGL